MPWDRASHAVCLILKSFLPGGQTDNAVQVAILGALTMHPLSATHTLSINLKGGSLVRLEH